MRSKSFFSIFLFLVVFGGLGAMGYVFFKDMQGPTLTLTPDFDKVSPERELTLTASDPSNIRSVQVFIRKNNKSIEVFKKYFDEKKPEQTVAFNLKNADMRDGSFDLEIKVTDASLAGFGQGNTTTRTTPMRFDVTPPRINVVTLPPYIRRGGAGVIRYTLDEVATYSGVRIGETFFPGYLQADNSFICFFPFPYNLEPAQFQPQITAEDVAGNVVTRPLAVNRINRKFKQDTITITDAFLEKVSNVLADLAPNADNPLQRFLIINKDIRSANVQFLQHLAAETVPQMLWQGAFARLPKAASRAGYADHRTYVYQGKEIDAQSHLGFDLASLAHAEVPAANNGRVIFTGPLGIYGNLVVLDHGMGVMSLYSHLSSIEVTRGDTVTKGQTIAKTGSTGMAFGDHLHFGVLVGGMEVTPLEWLDPKWIRDNVTSRLSGEKK